MTDTQGQTTGEKESGGEDSQTSESLGGESWDDGEARPGDEPAGLERARFVSYILDEAIRVPGTNYRIGLDPILGVLPVAGDAISAGLSLYPVLEAYRLGVPRNTLTKMVARVGIDAVVGSVPVLGGVFDAVWKANEWNVKSIEQHLTDN